MCLAIPGKVIQIDGDEAVVDYESEQRRVGAHMIDNLEIGDYVLVQAKMIVQKVPRAQAEQAIEMVREHGSD